MYMRDVLGTVVAAGEANVAYAPPWIQGLRAARGWSQLGQEELSESLWGGSLVCIVRGHEWNKAAFSALPHPRHGSVHLPPRCALLTTGVNGNIHDLFLSSFSAIPEGFGSELAIQQPQNLLQTLLC